MEDLAHSEGVRVDGREDVRPGPLDHRRLPHPGRALPDRSAQAPNRRALTQKGLQGLRLTSKAEQPV